MESRISSLFDFQRFENEPSLQEIIDSGHQRVREGEKKEEFPPMRRMSSIRELSLDEMGMLSAAGQVDLTHRPKPGSDHLD